MFITSEARRPCEECLFDDDDEDDAESTTVMGCDFCEKKKRQSQYHHPHHDHVIAIKRMKGDAPPQSGRACSALAKQTQYVVGTSSLISHLHEH